MPPDRRRPRSNIRKRTAKLRDEDELRGLALDAAPSNASARVSRATRTARPAEAEGIDWREEFQRLQWLTLSITVQLDIRLLVSTILNEAIGTMGADRGVLFLGRQNAGGLIPVCAANFSGEDLRSVDRVSRTILAEARKGQFVQTPDALKDSRFASVASIQKNRLRSILCAPLVAPTGQVGAIYLDAAEPNAFPSGVMPIFEALIRVAAVALQNAEMHGAFVREHPDLRPGEPARPAVEDIVGRSAVADGLRRQAVAISPLEQPVLLIGEPGSGRSNFARVVHALSTRGHGVFVACDASVFPAAQLRRMLLGRTGASPRGTEAWETGLMRQANHGTLYVSRSDLLNEETAHDLIRMADDGEYRPLGSRHDERLDVRLILAADPSRRGESDAAKTFRSIQPCEIYVPPLREHPEDIPDLVTRFLSAEGSRREGSQRTFTPQSLSLLQQQPWPGNVRELQQVIRRIKILTPQKSVVDIDETKAALALVETGARISMGPWSGTVRTLKEWEEEAFRQALLHTHGNRKEAAALLGVHRNTMTLKMREYGL